MNVVVLSDHACEGGAAVAATRLCQALLGLDGKLQLQRCHFFPAPGAGIVLMHTESAAVRQVLRPIRKLLPAWLPHPNTPAHAAGRLRRALAGLRPDIINVHNLHAAGPWGWGPHLIEVCLEFAPVVWTLHDMWSFTGRCAYSYDCEKFIAGCDSGCPTPTEAPALAPEKIRAAWEERRSIYDRHPDDLVLVTPSHWLASQARRGLFARHRIEVIPYGVPSAADMVPRESARRELGISTAGPVLLLAAVDLSERRKGAALLPDLWPAIHRRPLTVLSLGNGVLPAPAAGGGEGEFAGITVRPLGFVADERRKALIFAAADALLHPAPVDNFPNVVLEALAAGTPTIALPIGGLPELVRPGISGWLADAPNAAALGQAVDAALAAIAAGRDLRASCRALAATEYPLALPGRRYFELFEQLQRR